MAGNKLILNRVDQAVDLGLNAQVVGSSATEIIRVAEGCSADVSPGNGDRTELPGRAADYTVTVQGNTLVLTEGTNTIRLTIGGSSTVAFADGEAVVDTQIDLSAGVISLRLSGVVLSDGFNLATLNLNPLNPPALASGTTDVLNRLLLNDGDQAFELGFDAQVVGSSGVEQISVVSGAEVSFSAGNGDRVTLAGSLADYTATSQGNTVTLRHANGSEVSLIAGGASRVAFDDGEAALDTAIDLAAGRIDVRLGGEVVDDNYDPAQVALDDGTDTDTDTDTDTTTLPSYVVTASALSVTEGDSVTFSLSTHHLPAGTRQVGYSLSGIESADIGGAPLQGYFELQADGTATLTLNLTDDQLSESETLLLQLPGVDNVAPVQVQIEDSPSGLLLQAEALSSINTGSERTSWLSDEYISTLRSLSYWPGGEISYSFNEVEPTDYTVENHTGFMPLTSTARSAVRNTITEIESFSQLNFTEVEHGEMRFSAVDMQSDDMYAYAYYPGGWYTEAGDVFMNNQAMGVHDYDDGGYPYYALLHEMGHAMSLKHPHEGNLRMPDELDDHSSTVMSYQHHEIYSVEFSFESGFVSGAAYVDRYPSNYTLYDVQYLQAKYGANTSTAVDDTTWVVNFDTVDYLTVWDAGGTDLIDASAAQGDSTIDLNGGTISSVDTRSASLQAELTIEQHGITSDWERSYIDSTFADAENLYTGMNNLSIVKGSLIENVTTGAGNDSITDNRLDNVITTGTGDDQIYLGHGGFDTVFGGSGNDTVYFQDSIYADASMATDNDGGHLLVVGSGAVRLVGVESVAFSDQVISLS